MFSILLVVCVLNTLHSTAKFTDYYREGLFADMICLSSAVKVSGLVQSVQKCAMICKISLGCLSFFYVKTDLECYSVDKVLTSRSGCESKTGASYYLRQADFDCYHFTSADQNKMDQLHISEERLCESYQFHVFTLGKNEAYRDCSGCKCCQWKGCFNGDSRDYDGTWSQTKYGRTCQRWDSQSPHGHTRTSPSGFPKDSSVYDAHNYCRNPDSEVGPWCYTNDPDVRFENCDISTC